MTTVNMSTKENNHLDEINGSNNDLSTKNDILRTLDFLHPDGSTFELTCIGPSTPKSPLWEGFAAATGSKKPVITGFFSDHQKAAELALKLDNQVRPNGIYVTLNPCDPDLRARASERLKAGINRTSGDNVLALKNLLIDADPIRLAGASSSEQEHQFAIEKINEIREYLTGLGWPEPLVGDSGNGAHLLYKTDSENTPENVEIRKRCLKALSAKFSSKEVAVDEQVFDAPRITKLYGTTARKGDALPHRPHRPARIISVPDDPEVVSIDLLKALADMTPEEHQKSAAQNISKNIAKSSVQGVLDVQMYLDRYEIAVKRIKPHGTSTLYILEECLFDPSHAGGEAAIGQSENGTLFYQCFHDSCKDRSWAEARKMISGEDKLDEFLPHSPRGQESPQNQRRITAGEGIGNGKIILPPPPVFPMDVFPPRVRLLIQAIADAHTLPVEIPASALLVLAGACIGRTRGIEIKKGWIEHPNLYMGAVGRSGVGKSPSTRTVFHPVFDLEKEWFQKYTEEVRAMEEADDKSANPPPQCRQLIVEDTSPEALSDALTGNPRGILWYRDELGGLLLEMDKYSNKAGGTKTRLMSAYDSGTWKVNRISARRNCFIPHATLSIFGTIQPMALPDIFSNRDAATGFLPRFIFLRVDRETPPFWTDAGITSDVRKALAKMIQGLLDYNFGDEEEPLIVQVSPAAKMRYIEWFNQQVAEPWRDHDAVMYEALLAKLRGQCLRLCLILHCMDAFEQEQSELLPVTEMTMKNAIRLANCIKEHQKQVWQFLVSPSKIEEFSPIQKRVAQAIVSLSDEIQGGMLPTARITEKINEGMDEKFHASSVSVGRAAASLGFSSKHISSSTNRGISVTEDDLARLKPLVEKSGLSGTSGSDPLSTDVYNHEASGSEVVQVVLEDEPPNHLDHIQITTEESVNPHGDMDQTTSTTCTAYFEGKNGRDRETRNTAEEIFDLRIDLNSCQNMDELKAFWESNIDHWQKIFNDSEMKELIEAKDWCKRDLAKAQCKHNEANEHGCTDLALAFDMSISASDGRAPD